MNSVLCRPHADDTTALRVVQSIIARFHPELQAHMHDGALILASETVNEQKLRRTFVAATLTARLSANSSALRTEVWNRLLR